MLFNSLPFLVFMLVFLGGWQLLPGHLARRLWLLGGSWLFYASWEPRFLLLLLFSTALDYGVGLRLEATETLCERGGGHHGGDSGFDGVKSGGTVSGRPLRPPAPRAGSQRHGRASTPPRGRDGRRSR